MTAQTVSILSGSTGAPAEIRQVHIAAPFEWLRAGVRSLAAAPGPSLLYGALFALAAAAAVYLTRTLPGFTVAFITGLLLIGPFLATGIYVAARQQQGGERASIGGAITFLGTRSANMGLYALFLALIMVVWVRVSALLFALKFNTFNITVDGYLGILSGSGDPTAIAYFVLIGFALALTVFITSAVAIPMIVDRNCGPLTAIHTSARAFATNWPAMLVWAALIVALTAVGIATYFVGLVVLFPVLGYATWHSYTALVSR